MNRPKTPDTVVITLDENGVPDYSSVELSKSGHQRIIWVSKSAEECHIQFSQPKGSPFGTDFKVPKFGWQSSGEIDLKAAPDTYTYNVSRAGQIAADPDVIIRN